jgi:hypothetical protein
MQAYKSKRSGVLFEEVTNDSYTKNCQPNEMVVCPLGGGFVARADRKDFEMVEVEMKKVRGWATLGDHPDVYSCTYNPNAKWNGWDTPSFTKKVVNQMAKNWHGELVRTEDDMEADTEHYEHWRLVTKYNDDFYVRRLKGKDVWIVDTVCWECLNEEELKTMGEIEGIDHKKYF